MNILEAILLGAVQGVTTFFPVSSVGHLILARTLLDTTESTMFFFQAMIYFATATATLLYFLPDIWMLLQVGLRKLGKLPVNKSDETLLYALMIATFPVLILGLSLDSLVVKVISSPFLVALILMGGSVFFMYAEWVYQSRSQTNIMTPKKGLKMGLFQTLALLPGMSRFGSVIAGGMLMGLSRVESARFAFLLAIPLLTGLGLEKFIGTLSSKEMILWFPVLIGTVTAFISALFALRFMMRFMHTHTLWLFIWYRIILAGFVVFVTVFG